MSQLVMINRIVFMLCNQADNPRLIESLFMDCEGRIRDHRLPLKFSFLLAVLLGCCSDRTMFDKLSRRFSNLCQSFSKLRTDLAPDVEITHSVRCLLLLLLCLFFFSFGFREWSFQGLSQRPWNFLS